MRIAALYDIHGNLPALEAVAREVRHARVDCIVVGGDVLPGPMPNETLDFLFNLRIPVQFLIGNGELAVLAQIAAMCGASSAAYWGTTNGEPPPESARVILHWSAQQPRTEHAKRISSWPKTLHLTVGGFGDVLCCHGTPRSELECFTRLTSEDLLLPVFEQAGAQLVICGDTHMQFDRMIGLTRVVNAGSVGMPFQSPAGAYWLLLDEGVELRHTRYDLNRAADRVRTTNYPEATISQPAAFSIHHGRQKCSKRSPLCRFDSARRQRFAPAAVRSRAEVPISGCRARETPVGIERGRRAKSVSSRHAVRYGIAARPGAVASDSHGSRCVPLTVVC